MRISYTKRLKETLEQQGFDRSQPGAVKCRELALILEGLEMCHRAIRKRDPSSDDLVLIENCTSRALTKLLELLDRNGLFKRIQKEKQYATADNERPGRLRTRDKANSG